jgi:outer membrane protein TolC
LLASWYQLLAKNSALAYAHKQRFPSISITTSLTDSRADISDLLSSSSLGWSLLGNITMPLFNAGKLKANEEKARLTLKQTEQTYLSTLYNAFADVENAVTTEATLTERYQIMLKAQENAIAAETLSFEQYQKGLVEYTTVLDAQSRSYDAQSTVIQIKNQLITNRINLHIALGGNFAKSSSAEVQEQDK